jgi:hypothetical protein
MMKAMKWFLIGFFVGAAAAGAGVAAAKSGCCSPDKMSKMWARCGGGDMDDEFMGAGPLSDEESADEESADEESGEA